MLPKLCQIPNREEEEEESLVISTFPLFFLLPTVRNLTKFRQHEQCIQKFFSKSRSKLLKAFLLANSVLRRQSVRYPRRRPTPGLTPPPPPPSSPDPTPGNTSPEISPAAAAAAAAGEECLRGKRQAGTDDPGPGVNLRISVSDHYCHSSLFPQFLRFLVSYEAWGKNLLPSRH